MTLSARKDAEILALKRRIAVMMAFHERTENLEGADIRILLQNDQENEEIPFLGMADSLLSHFPGVSNHAQSMS